MNRQSFLPPSVTFSIYKVMTTLAPSPVTLVSWGSMLQHPESALSSSGDWLYNYNYHYWQWWGTAGGFLRNTRDLGTRLAFDWSCSLASEEHPRLGHLPGLWLELQLGFCVCVWGGGGSCLPLAPIIQIKKQKKSSQNAERFQKGWKQYIIAIAIKRKPETSNRGFPGSPVIKDPPADAEDMGSIPSLGSSHLPRSN